MFLRIFPTALLLTALPLLAADGQNCYYGGHYQGSYYRPAPYVAPSPGYNFHAPPPYLAQKIVAQEIAIAPLVVTVPIASQAVPIQAYGANHYYSVQEAYQQRAMIRDVIREELRNFLKTQGSEAVPPVSATPNPKTVPNPNPPAPGPGGKKVPDLGPDNETDPRIAQTVLGAWQKAGCMSCHTGENADLSGGLRLAYSNGGSYQLAKQSKERAWMIYGQMSTGWMPPAARKDASKAAPQDTLPPVLQWVVQGSH